MDEKGKNFLILLAELMEQHDAQLGYTIDDDGIHIEVAGDEVFVGFLDGRDAPRQLRQTALQRGEP